MALPWFQILDAVIGVTDLARSRRIRRMSQESADPQQQLDATARPGALGGLETRLAGVVVAALKEAFERDTRRLELEREQLEAERKRAERALKLEIQRQTGDREIARLRLLAGIAVASWVGTLFFSGRLIAAQAAVRVALGASWLLLLAAFASSFVAQSEVADQVNRADERSIESGIAGAFALWLIVFGLALFTLAQLTG